LYDPFVRSTFAWVAILAAAGTGVFWWQRSEIVSLRSQVARQGDALENLIGASRERNSAPGLLASARTAGLRRWDDNSAALRADERRVILDQYRDILAQMNLPPATASRLQDLLTDRVEAVLDAQDAAMREGFAEGSAETAQAVTLAITEVDREIANLVGPNGNRVLDGLPPMVSPQPAVMPEPAAPVSVVNVVVQTPPAPYYADPTAPAAVADTSSLYSAYPDGYYPVTALLIGGVSRPFGGLRTGAVRPFRASSEDRGTRVAFRTR
jgi:hypothetical protein